MSAPQISYRDGTVSDAAVLAALFARSFTETFGHLYTPENLSSFLSRLDEQGWREELADPDISVRVAEAGGEVVAFAKVGTLTLPVMPSRPSGELRQLYILKPWQGRGLAEELMRWSLDRVKASGALDCYLTVYVDNHRARRFYERYRFTFVAPYVFKVGEHEDEDMIMRMSLEEWHGG